MADEKPKDWVDFTKAKAVRFEVALEALGLLATLRRDGEQLQGICPLHTSTSEKESFGVHTGKQTFNCFACKKHGKVLDFVMQYRDIDAKEAAQWLVSLVDNGEVQESVQVEAAGVPAAGNGAVPSEKITESQARAATSAVFNEREVWLVGVIAQGVAWYLSETFKPLADVGTMEKCIVAKVAMAAGLSEAGANGPQIKES